MESNYRFGKIAVKIGSNVITREDGTLNFTQMSSLVDQIAFLHTQGVEIIIISSGAVASGRGSVEIRKKMDPVDQRQLFSAVGQAKLINTYWELFRNYNIPVGQVLATKENFSTRRLYLNQRNSMKVMLENKVIPIVNENDTVSVSELMFTDNDELSGLVASMMNFEALFLLSDVDGIYNGPLSDPSSRIIPEISPQMDLDDYITSSKSSFGRGGMSTKASIASRIASEGIEVYIANGKRQDIIVHLMDRTVKVNCSHFQASSDIISPVKKWIAHSDDFAKGEIYIDRNAVKALGGEKASSLLPVGIVSVKGTFEKDDIVKIFGPEGNLLGVGKVRYDSETVKKIAGMKNHKPVIHCDYLYLE